MGVNPRTGLRHGDAARIARKHKCSRQHVSQVAKGDRPGRPALLETIRRYQERAKAAQAA